MDEIDQSSRAFRDTVHNLIEVHDEREWRLLDALMGTSDFQRLRRIRQNGFSNLIYPSLEGSRLPHAIGSYYIAKKLVSALARKERLILEYPEQMRITRNDELGFCLAALLHDIGHGPFSHVWEEVCDRVFQTPFNHETMAVDIIGSAETEIGSLLSALALSDSEAKGCLSQLPQFLSCTHRLHHLCQFLSGPLDVDRLDFLSRDTKMAGVSYGFNDADWILRSLKYVRIGEKWIIAIDGKKGGGTLKQFFGARENMYNSVYLHKTARAATRQLLSIFERVRDLSQAGFRFDEQWVEAMSHGIELSPKDHLLIDDGTIWEMLKRFRQYSDPVLSHLSRDFLSRQLFYVEEIQPEMYDDIKGKLEYRDGPLNKAAAEAIGCRPDELRYFIATDECAFNLTGSSNNASDELHVLSNAHSKNRPDIIPIQEYMNAEPPATMRKKRNFFMIDRRARHLANEYIPA